MFAQHPIVDSIKIALKEEPSFYVGMHNRNTFIQTNTIKLYGLVMGLDYAQKIKIYAGVYGFGRPSSGGRVSDRDRFGSISYIYKDNQKEMAKDKFIYVPLELGAKSSLSLIDPYLALTGEVGYRIQIGKKEAALLSAPYFGLGISIRLGELYSLIKNR